MSEPKPKLNYAKGNPVDVVTLSLNRAKALAEIVESYAIQGGDDAHAVPVETQKLALIVTMIGDHIDIAREAFAKLAVCDCV